MILRFVTNSSVSKSDSFTLQAIVLIVFSKLIFTTLLIPALLNSFAMPYWSSIACSISDAPINWSSTEKYLRMHALANGDENCSSTEICLSA